MLRVVALYRVWVECCRINPAKALTVCACALRVRASGDIHLTAVTKRVREALFDCGVYLNHMLSFHGLSRQWRAASPRQTGPQPRFDSCGSDCPQRPEQAQEQRDAAQGAE